MSICFVFFNDTATTEIYTLSLHDALPIYRSPNQSVEPPGVVLDRQNPDISEPGLARVAAQGRRAHHRAGAGRRRLGHADRKSTRLNSSHANISYAVFCLKKT